VHAYADTPLGGEPATGSPATTVASSPPDAPADPLRHHGDVEARGLLDFAVNVYAGPRPGWLDEALHASLDQVGAYPTAADAERALATRHGVPEAEVLATAGAAEAFSLVARWRPWRRPVVVHPQFTEPHAALEQAGHLVTEVLCTKDDGFALDPDAVPDDADLVVVGNPTNPTGVLHPASAIGTLLRPGRVVVVDEAFMDTVPGEPESLAGARLPGLVVVRSLTKHWGIPGVRAGYLVAEAGAVGARRAGQVPWSVSTTAAAAMLACSTRQAAEEAEQRAQQIQQWRAQLEESLCLLGIPHLRSSASFVLARVGEGLHNQLRGAGIAVRRADTFPGLDASWVRIAVRPPEPTARLIDTVDALSRPRRDALG
jgi:histidinol-phosphate/aromatic aminotransferase/cobyric acid decarboxylase-like protein